MQREIITTENAPAAVGPYSQAVCAGALIYTAGQIPLDPRTGKLVDGDVQTQTRQVIHNLEAVLDAAGSSLNNVIKTTVFLSDINDYAAVNEVYGSFFGDSTPARSAVQVAALPLGARLEIEVVALREES